MIVYATFVVTKPDGTTIHAFQSKDAAMRFCEKVEARRKDIDLWIRPVWTLKREDETEENIGYLVDDFLDS